MTTWIVLSINPDPWAIGPLGVGKRNGKYYPYVGRNQQLHDFKQAVKDELSDEAPLPIGKYDLYFYFWRRLDEHESGRKHEADATNLQKATEDALQEVLIGNDRDVRRVGSEIVEQSATATPCIVIRAAPYLGHDPTEIPDTVWEKITLVQTQVTQESDNTWGGPNG